LGNKNNINNNETLSEHAESRTYLGVFHGDFEGILRVSAELRLVPNQCHVHASGF
jgi:hypothetical protein